MRDLWAALELPVTEKKLAQVVEEHSFENITQREWVEGEFYRMATSGPWKDDLTPEQAKTVENTIATLINELSNPESENWRDTFPTPQRRAWGRIHAWRRGG